MEFSVNEIMQFVVGEALILIPVLFILAATIKHSTAIKNEYIPLILLFLGIALAMLLLGFSVNSLIQGILVAGVPGLAHQIYKQSKQ